MSRYMRQRLAGRSLTVYMSLNSRSATIWAGFSGKHRLILTKPLLIRIRDALTRLSAPTEDKNIIAAGRVEGLHANEADGAVRFALKVDGLAAETAQSLLNAAKTAVENVEGAAKVTAVATLHHAAGRTPSKAASQALASAHDNPIGLPGKQGDERDAPYLVGVKNVIAVASGKGGVGKSTITVNLATALARRGLSVGLLDADIYGPSLPTLLGLRGKARMEDGKIIPHVAYGLRAMSIGVMIDPEQALAWRGPMVMGALKQLLRDVAWGPLDLLLVDTPPGTGDVHLSLIQSKKLTGAIIVSTPQEMALADMRRGAQLFRKTGTPILGVIENMAWLETETGERLYLFGEGGAERAAMALNAPFLGAVPLAPELRIASDEGSPIAAGDHPAADVFKNLAQKIASTLPL